MQHKALQEQDGQKWWVSIPSHPATHAKPSGNSLEIYPEARLLSPIDVESLSRDPLDANWYYLFETSCF